MANLGHDIKIVEVSSKNSNCCLGSLMIASVLFFFLIGIIFSIVAPFDEKPVSAVFFVLGAFLPLIIFIIYGLISRNTYKINPELEISIDWVVQGTLCPKCRIGKIHYSILYDGNEDLCGNTNNQIFVCLNCKTVYPENYLTMYFGMNPLWARRNS